MKIITFLTDFGIKSGYPAQMKGVVSTLTNAFCIDITHDIKPYNIHEGAFVLLTTAPYFPIGTVHVAVVDPGVGTERKGIFIKTKSQILIGPDNGLLLPTAHNLGDFTVYNISKDKFLLNSISNTFHGRDIFAPIAADIVNGVPFEKIGKRITDYIDLNFKFVNITCRSTIGKVIYIDPFGNIITNIMGNKLKNYLSYSKKVSILINNKRYILQFVKSYNFVNNNQLLLTINSSNLVEIGINKGNASKKLGIKFGDEIKILFN
jgi:S-adenosylmethionine hydrolase